MKNPNVKAENPKQIEKPSKLVKASDSVLRIISLGVSSAFWFVRFKLIGGIFYQVKCAFQALRNGGFPDAHIFELGYFACKWVLPRLDKFIESHQGWPDSDFASDKAYTEALGDVRFFLNSWSQGDLDWDDKAQVARYQKGKKLSHLVFTLWD